MEKDVMVIGSGGREHAIAWKLAQSQFVNRVYLAPGNGGTHAIFNPKLSNLPIDGADKKVQNKLLNFVERHGIDMIVVGPEQPLVDGIVDFFNDNDYNRIFGPTATASQLEADKFFSCDVMTRAGIPQARSVQTHSLNQGWEHLGILEKKLKNGIVLKARGLTGGKGVRVYDTVDDARKDFVNFVDTFGKEVLIAERLYGQEFSVFGISDGHQVKPLELSVQDHKPLFNGDKGPNTGGMGAYCPAPIADADIVKMVAENMMTPAVQELAEQGIIYKGFLYAGMMMTDTGPQVIEYNIRFGDPECQPAMMMLDSDLYQIIDYALQGDLDSIDFKFKPGAACCVVLASQGYPGKINKGIPITGLDAVAEQYPGIEVFHAGTTYASNKHVTSGGRVVGVTGYSPEGIVEVRKLVYDAAALITTEEGLHCRTDIAQKAIQK